MLKAFKYRIYPTDEQAVLMHKTFGCARLVYNHYLEMQENNYKAGKKHMSAFDCIKDLNRNYKPTTEWLKEPDKFALANAVFDLSDAYDRFFKGLGGHPQFKKKRADQSYSTNRTGNNIAIGDKYVKLPKLGKVPAKVHRNIPDGSVIKRATVSETATHKFYVSVLVDTPDAVPKSIKAVHADKVIGLDYSSHDFFVDCDNNTPTSLGYAYDHWYRKMQKKLAREQKKLSRMIENAKRSGRKLSECKNIQKQKTVVAKIHEKIANRRSDFTNKLSAAISKQYDAVVVEDINLRGMAGTLNFGKATSDNGFGEFRRELAYKLLWRGKYFVTVDKFFPSTQICSACGCQYEGIRGVEHLDDREWVCPVCGTHHFRDQNAAINLKNEGIRILQEQGVLVV